MIKQETILIVSYVTNHYCYKQCLRQILSLPLPKNFKLEFFSIFNTESMASAYNQAVNHPAKYKIYMHQDVLILRKTFLIDLIKLFEKYPQVGVIGMVGCKQIPKTGIWWEAKKLVGKIIEYRDYRYTTLAFEEENDDEQDIQFVQAVDGMLIATQYNVNWREDVLDGFHFYDVSQSLEFQRQNYLVGVPVQIEPWCLCTCNNIFRTGLCEEQRIKFLNHYMLD